MAAPNYTAFLRQEIKRAQFKGINRVKSYRIRSGARVAADFRDPYATQPVQRPISF
jgi:hypothetical protein